MSRILYIKCDRCGKQFIPDETHRIGWVGINWKDPETDDLTDRNPIEDMEFCEECMESIAAFIKGVTIEKTDPPEVEIVVEEPPREEPETSTEAPEDPSEPSEPEKPKKNPPVKKGIDKGKIRSLWTATPPRSVKWIADDLKCSEAAVRYHLRQMGLLGGDADDRS